MSIAFSRSSAELKASKTHKMNYDELCTYHLMEPVVLLKKYVGVDLRGWNIYTSHWDHRGNWRRCSVAYRENIIIPSLTGNQNSWEEKCPNMEAASDQCCRQTAFLKQFMVHLPTIHGGQIHHWAPRNTWPTWIVHTFFKILVRFHFEFWHGMWWIHHAVATSAQLNSCSSNARRVARLKRRKCFLSNISLGERPGCYQQTLHCRNYIWHNIII